MVDGRVWLAVLVALAGCRTGSAPATQGPGDPVVLDTAGTAVHPLRVAGPRAAVLVFTTVDCPIANAYAPELAALAGEFAGTAEFTLVHVDPDVDAARAAQHARDYGLGMRIVLDPRHALVEALGVRITPEVAVLLPGGAVAYQGRIDDRYADLGVQRAAPTRRDLREALAACAAGRAVAVPRTTAVGCYVPDPFPR